jgi:hypothetical protein
MPNWTQHLIIGLVVLVAFLYVGRYAWAMLGLGGSKGKGCGCGSGGCAKMDDARRRIEEMARGNGSGGGAAISSQKNLR